MQEEGEFAEKYCGGVYLWKSVIEKNISMLSLLRKSPSLLEGLKSNFFGLERGRSEAIAGILESFKQHLIKIYPNLNLNFEETIRKFITLYIEFHVENDSSKINYMNTILNNAKARFKLKEVSSRFLRSDLMLGDVEKEFLSEMYENKNFTKQDVFNCFMIKFKYFFPELNQEIKDQLQSIISQNVQLYSEKKDFLQQMIGEEMEKILDSYKNIQRFQILMLEVVNAKLIINVDWETDYESIFVEQNMTLSQVLSLRFNFLLMVVALNDSDKVLLLFSESFKSDIVKNGLLTDKNTIIAGGSSEKCLIFYKNSEKKYLIGIITLEKLLIIEKCIDLNFNTKQITCFAVIPNTKELLFLGSEGKIHQINLLGQSGVQVPQILTKYFLRKIQISSCQNFIFCFTNETVFMLDTGLQILTSENGFPFFVDFQNDSINLYTRDNERLEVINFDCPNVNNVKTSNRLSTFKFEDINYICKCAVGLMKNILELDNKNTVLENVHIEHEKK